MKAVVSALGQTFGCATIASQWPSKFGQSLNESLPHYRSQCLRNGEPRAGRPRVSHVVDPTPLVIVATDLELWLKLMQWRYHLSIIMHQWLPTPKCYTHMAHVRKHVLYVMRCTTSLEHPLDDWSRLVPLARIVCAAQTIIPAVVKFSRRWSPKTCAGRARAFQSPHIWPMPRGRRHVGA